MGRLLLGVSGAVFGPALLAANAAPTATHGGWLPTLGAFALGGLLGPLFGGSGFGAAFILTLLAVLAVLAPRLWSKARVEPSAPFPFAGPGAAPPPSQVAASAAPAPQPRAAHGPADFDAAEFLRSAKLSFVKVQAARDLGRLDHVRELTTPAMYDRLRVDRSARQFDLVALNADLLELGTEAGRQQASVRFSGMTRAAPGAAPVGFVEVWNLAKPADGASGWLLAGIAQMN
ncbi:MAG: Tim44 domain-containing protein [Burkholderiales bacterium]